MLYPTWMVLVLLSPTRTVLVPLSIRLGPWVLYRMRSFGTTWVARVTISRVTA